MQSNKRKKQHAKFVSWYPRTEIKYKTSAITESKKEIRVLLCKIMYIHAGFFFFLHNAPKTLFCPFYITYFAQCNLHAQSCHTFITLSIVWMFYQFTGIKVVYCFWCWNVICIWFKLPTTAKGAKRRATVDWGRGEKSLRFINCPEEWREMSQLAVWNMHLL